MNTSLILLKYKRIKVNFYLTFDFFLRVKVNVPFSLYYIIKNNFNFTAYFLEKLICLQLRLCKRTKFDNKASEMVINVTIIRRYFSNVLGIFYCSK